MSDKAFLNSILLSCSKGACRLFRMNVGTGWIGSSQRFSREESVRVRPGDVLIRNARSFHAGVKGMADLCGWVSRDIGPEDVGKRLAVFASLEAKQGAGRMTPEQKNWRDQVQAAGGIAGEVRSVEDALRLLD